MSRDREPELVEVTGTIKAETKLAILFDDGEFEVWIPKSQIEWTEKDEDGLLVIAIPEWLALDKELI